MSEFEKRYQIDPEREAQFSIESASIELPELEYLRKIASSETLKDAEAKLEKAFGPSDKSLGEIDAKNESESPKSKPKKAYYKSNKTAVAGLQKKL